jgi:hypothetical protein
LQLRAQLVIFVLELAKVLRKFLVRLKPADRLRQSGYVDRRTNPYEENGTVQVEGTPGFEDFRFRDGGSNGSDLQRTGLCGFSAGLFLYIEECRFEIHAGFLHCPALGSLEDFLFCPG